MIKLPFNELNVS